MNHPLLYVMAVPLIVWVGIAGYLFHMERVLRGLERRGSGDDEV